MSKSVIILLVLLLSSCHPPRVVTVDTKEFPLDIETPPAQQTAQIFEKTNYFLYLPEGYGKQEKQWPLILYLHGKSLRGDDLEMLKSYGLAALLDKDLAIPFVVASPQCPADRYWVDEDQTLVRLLDEISSKYSVDRERIYVSGHSMGAVGSWWLAYNHPEKFAAIVPIAGAPRDNSWAKQIARVPAWAFHGTRDDLAPFERTKNFVALLSNLGAEIKFTPLPERDHFILDTYENKGIYDWLLQHKKR